MTNNNMNTTNITTDAEAIRKAIDNGNIPKLGKLLDMPSVTDPTPFTLEGAFECGTNSVIPCFPWNYSTAFSVSYELFLRFAGHSAQKYIEEFGEDIVKEAVQTLTWNNFTNWKDVEEKALPYYLLTLHGILIDNKKRDVTVTRHKGVWSMEETVKGYRVLILNEYTFCWENNFLKYCMISKYPYLSLFNISYHKWEGPNDTEFYINVKKPESRELTGCSLYCPYMALKNNDYSIIVDRQTKYFTEYYRWPGGWGKDVTEEQVLGWRKENIDLIHSEVGQKLKQILDFNITKDSISQDSQDYSKYLEYKEMMDAFTKDKAKKIDVLTQRYAVYGTSNLFPVKPVTFRTFKEAVKHIAFTYAVLNQLGKKFYKDVIDEHPESFTIREDIGYAIMHFQNDAFNVYYEVSSINI